MHNKLLSACAALLCASLAVTLAPTATADYGHHYDDPEAQMWYDFAHDKAVEINLLRIRNTQLVEIKTDYAVDHILYYCMNIRGSGDMAQHLVRARKNAARRAKFNISKCIWQAQMELDACYQDARQQLEDAGYEYFFIDHVYPAYRTTQRDLVHAQRYANMHIAIAVDCGSW